METAIREAVLSAGARALAKLMEGIGSGRRSESVVCECGARMESKGMKKKEILTILGPVSWSRSMFLCPSCKCVRYPGDEELDVVGTTRSPGLRRMMARAGSRSTFKEGREDLKVYAGITVSAKDVERVAEGAGEDMEAWTKKERETILCRQEPARPEKTIPVLYVSYDGTGVPMIKKEVAGRKGKQPDGTARTREAKLGCVFTQTNLDKNGRPARDDGSTTFVGAIETSDRFGERIYGEAVRRGLSNAEKVVILGDGARWVRNLAQTHFHDAIQIIDLYHAREHISNLSGLCFVADEKQVARWRIRWWTDLDEGGVEKIIRQARDKLPQNSEAKEKAELEINYLSENKERMRYADFRKQGLFVGSGVVEAGCKTVIGQRLKRSGMEWSVRGANAIISLRCTFLSGRMEDYWEARCA